MNTGFVLDNVNSEDLSRIETAEIHYQVTDWGFDAVRGSIANTIIVAINHYDAIIRIMSNRRKKQDRHHPDITDNAYFLTGGATKWYWKDGRCNKSYGPFGSFELAAEYKTMKRTLSASSIA